MVRKQWRWANTLAVLMLLLTLAPAGGINSYAQGDSRTFAETGKTVKGTFLW